MTVNRRIVSVLAALIMVLAMIPLMTETAHADDTMTWSDLKTALEAGGTVTMTNDITRDSWNYITISSEATLDLNGFTLDGAGQTYRNQQIFNITENTGKLTIKDDSQEKKGTVQNGNDEVVNIDGEFTLESGTIKGSVYVYSSGSSFTMTGGTICDGGWYGVILEQGGHFTMTGGIITNCKIGVYLEGESSSMAVGGSAKVKGNTDTNVQLYYARNEFGESVIPIEIVYPLSADASIGVGLSPVGTLRYRGTPLIFTSGLRDMGSLENFFGDNEYKVELKENIGLKKDKELQLLRLTEWGNRVDNSGTINYVDGNGTTSAKVSDKPLVWLKETSGDESVWYGLDNSNEQFRPGSRFWVRCLDPVSDKKLYDEYYNKLDEEHKKAVENNRIRIYIAGVTDPKGTAYAGIEQAVDGFIQIPEGWDKDDINVVSIGDQQDEILESQTLDPYRSPEGDSAFTKVQIHHFSSCAIYDKASDTPGWSPARKVNPLKVKGNTATVKYSKLKKSQTLKASKVIKTVKKGQGKLSYQYVSAKKGNKSFKKYFKINKKNGRVTVKKGLKKGTYKVTVKVRAAGNKEYLASSWKSVTFKIRIK